jgi:hypothetical protein
MAVLPTERPSEKSILALATFSGPQPTTEKMLTSTQCLWGQGLIQGLIRFGGQFCVPWRGSGYQFDYRLYGVTKE